MMKNYKYHNTRLFGIIPLVWLVVFLSGCETNAGIKQAIVPQMDFEEFEPLLHKQNDTLYIINFWASWCKPCIAEMPYFEMIGEKYSQEAVKVILVSLDFPDKREKLILPFIEKKGIKSQVIHLTDTKANEWIDKVSPEWSGAIPATVFYKGNSFRKFVEASMTFDELKQIVDINL